MSVTIERAERHVREWSKRLAPFRTRSNWPRHLFHTCQLEVALEIIRAGRILCRKDVPRLICDVANQGALWNNADAHGYVRLYFRPRNNFHLKTEGIKATGDPNRIDPHMSIPITFAFNFVKVIASQDSGFVAGNFARSGARPSDSDHNFDNLRFDLIYHDAATLPDQRTEIHNWRMSEVVVSRELALAKISCIVCRTIHEERTLRYMLNETIPHRTIIEQRGSIFMRRGIFIDEIYWAAGMMHLKFNGPIGFTKETYVVNVICHDQGTVTQGRYSVSPGISYRFARLQASAAAVWRIEFEGCLAYNGPIPSTSGLVVA
jgi:hypothetical protein